MKNDNNEDANCNCSELECNLLSFQCKYQFECLSSLETIYVIFILCCTIFHFLLFLDSLCLCLLFSHVQCCNHSDQLWERLKVSWTTFLCSEDFEMEKLVTDSSAPPPCCPTPPWPPPPPHWSAPFLCHFELFFAFKQQQSNLLD